MIVPADDAFKVLIGDIKVRWLRRRVTEAAPHRKCFKSRIFEMAKKKMCAA